MPLNGTLPATKEELQNFFAHLERELDECGFLRNLEARPSMVRNLRNMFQRADLTEQEVRTLHGMIKELTTLRAPRRRG
jgi:tRNA/rRNA methyltransferase